ncbi:hypothetical protein LINGRAHAP2_LOCUS17822 [Linum grandiflorum]
MAEGSVNHEMEDVAVIEARADCLGSSVIFHVIKDVIGFVLYMHQQIPSILQDLSAEYDNLQTECKDLETALSPCEAKGSFRRQQAGRMREIKRGIKKLQKLMNTVDGLETALQFIISQVPGMESVILILGSSPIRPHHVYEFCFAHGNAVAADTSDFTRNKVVEGLAKKVVPFRVQLKCRSQGLSPVDQNYASHTSNSNCTGDSASNDLIWFQCRHVLKGLAFKIPDEE